MIFNTAYRLARSVHRLYMSEKPKLFSTEELHDKGSSSGSVVHKKIKKSTESNSPNSSMKYADSLPFSDDITNHGVNAFYDIPSNTNMFRPINRSILNKEILPPINTAQRYYNYFNDPWYILCNYVLKPYQLQKKDPQGTDCRFRRAFVKSLLGIRNEKMINFLMMDDKYLKLIDKIAKKISPYNQALSVILSIYSIYDLVQQKHKNGEKITSKDLFENDTLRQSSIKCFAACMGLLNKIISTMANNDSLRMLKPNKKVCGLVEMASLIFTTSKILESRFLEPHIQHYYQNMASSSRRPTQAIEILPIEMPMPQDRVSSLHQPVQQVIEILPIEMPTPQDRVLSLRQETQQITERLLTLSSCSTSNQTPSTSSSEQSSTIGDVSIDTSSLSSPQKQFPDQKTGGKSQVI